VFIAPEFYEEYRDLRQSSRGQWHVIENWAPLEELPALPKVNSWSRQRGLDQKRVLLYSGTLGFKHNPDLLVALARHFRDSPEVVIAVISQGLGRSHLEKQKRRLALDNLRLFDYQCFEVFPDVMASADVLLSIIEREAGAFSVPSKVLTYMCASRPLLLSVPPNNLAARIVTRNRAGVVVEPADTNGFLRAARELIEKPEYAAAFARQARQYAMATFQIGRVADRFEAVLREALGEPLSEDHRSNRSSIGAAAR
jgi:glycosyltransferase involved in cell wall biosynthesis